MTEHQITEPGPVLDSRGVITPGYSTHSVSTYRRKDIKASCFRIKEWDFYQVSDGEKCLQLTYGHASYAGQVAVMLFNFRTGEVLANISKLLALPFGSLHLPENAEQNSDVRYDKGGIHLRFLTEGDTRYLSFSAPGFEACITLQRQNPNSLVIHIPFDEYQTAFYYNHKINCMTARGRAVCNGKEYSFGEDAYGLIDWGRGVWPFHNEWYWSNGTAVWTASCSASISARASATRAAPQRISCFTRAAATSSGAFILISARNTRTRGTSTMRKGGLTSRSSPALTAPLPQRCSLLTTAAIRCSGIFPARRFWTTAPS